MLLTRHLRLPSLVLASCLTITGCTKQRDADQSLAAAQNYYKSGNFAAAEIELKNVFREEPTNREAVRLLGLMLADCGSLMEAARLLTTVKSSFPEDDLLSVELAECLLKLSFVVDCRTELLELLKRSPENERAIMLLAESSISPEMISETEEVLDGLEDAPKHALDLANAMLDFRQGSIETGRSRLMKVLEEHPQDPRAHSLLTGLYLAENRSIKALEAARMASELAGPRSDESIAYVTLLMNQGQIDEAVTMLEKTVEETPEFLPAWRTLGMVELTRNYKEAATKHLTKVLEANPYDLQAAVIQSQIWIDGDQADKAIQLLTSLAEDFPQRTQLNFALARAYLATEEVNRAANALDRVLASAPGTPEAANLRAQLYLQDEETFRGISLLEKVLQQNPANLEARDLLVQAYRASGQPEEAIALLNEGIPGVEQPERRIDLSMLLASQGRTAEAYTVLEDAAGVFPDNLALVAQLASLDLAEDRAAKAERRLDDFISKHPESSEALVFRAGLALRREDFQQANELLNQALGLQEDSAPAFALMLRLKTLTKQDSEALVVLEKYLAFYPEDHQALLELANVQQRLEKFEDAVETLEKIIGERPDFAPAYNNLAEIQSEILDDLESAVKYARKARSLDSRRPEIADTLGWIEWKRGNYRQALILLEQAAAGLTDNPGILYHKGRTHYSLGEAGEALACLTAALSSELSFEGRKEAVRLHSLLAGGDNTDLKTLHSRVEKHPEDVVFVMQLADAQALAGDHTEALKTYQRAHELSPTLAEALVGQSKLYAESLNDRGLALETAEEAARIAPRKPSVMAALGRARFLTESFQEAYGLLKDAASGRPDDFTVRFHLALSAFGLGRIPEARDQMDAVSRSPSPLAEEAKEFLALTASNADRQADAQGAVKRGLLRPSTRGPALMLRARLEEVAQQDSTGTYLELLEVFPELGLARVALARIYLENPGKLEQASHHANIARESLPDDAELTGILATIAFRRSEFSHALQLLQSLETVRSLTALETFMLGMSKHRLGDPAAVATLQRSLDLGLEDANRDQALAAIEDRKQARGED